MISKDNHGYDRDENHQPKNPRKSSRRKNEFVDRTEIILAVCDYLLDGKNCDQIQVLMKKHFNVRVSRKAPLRYLQIAGQRDWVQLNAPGTMKLRNQLLDRYAELDELEVVHAVTSRPVAMRAASLLGRMVKRHALARPDEETVRIGWSGSVATRDVAEAFARLLCEPSQDWPDTIAIHTMAAGQQDTDPTTDPKTFFCSIFEHLTDLQVNVEFVTLPVPPLMNSSEIDVHEIIEMGNHGDIYGQGNEVDIIVTGAGSYQDPHCWFAQVMNASPEAKRVLDRSDCVGDVMWQPVGENGPIVDDTGVRFSSLLKLNDLPRRIEDGTKVLLLAAPCDDCSETKWRVVKVLLELEIRLLTHLVIDSLTARELLAADARNGRT